MATALPPGLRNRHLRRAVTVPAVSTGALALVASAGLWVPAAAAFDLLRGRDRLPTLRSLSLALGWSALETFGVIASAALWVGGRSRDRDVHYALQSWWAEQLIRVLHRTAGLTLEVDGRDLVAPARPAARPLPRRGRQPVRVHVTRVPRRDIPLGTAFPGWLDTQWARLDRELASSGDALIEPVRLSADNEACSGSPEHLPRGR